MGHRAEYRDVVFLYSREPLKIKGIKMSISTLSPTEEVIVANLAAKILNNAAKQHKYVSGKEPMPSIEDAVEQAVKWMDSTKEKGAWRNPTPVEVNFTKLWSINPRHKNCPLVVKVSPNNSKFIGLYCKCHGTHICWINNQQLKSLLNANIGIVNESPSSGGE